ncbi:MAG: translation initiation factor IF-6 [Methanospirillaceae archaeon]|nr:translation initiation factor IF-6 [Methanospirillaceae archaeon]
MDQTVSFTGDPHIGVFTRVFEDIAIVPVQAGEEYTQKVQKNLSVKVLETTIHGSPIVGSLLAGNSNGFVVTGLIREEERLILEEWRDLLLLHEGMNAAGNIILANDTFAAVHPDMDSDLVKMIESFLDVPVIRLTLGGIKTVGMAGVATNNGIIVNPRATPGEIAAIQEVTDLPVGVGSVNMGNVLVGTGLIANSHGYMAGDETSGFELGRIEDIFGFYG